MVPSKRRHLPDRTTQCRDTEGDNEYLRLKFKSPYLHAIPKTVTEQNASSHTRRRLKSNTPPQEKSVKRP
jgi:hypothetical protein